MISAGELAKITNAEVVGKQTPSTLITNILTDSRKHWYRANTIFVALQGASHNGEDFVEDLYQRGMRFFMVQKVPANQLPDASFLVVKNTFEALQKWAKFHRNSFTNPLIAITGSNGKTIVKEWLSILLESHFNVVKSPRSFNSQVGVPLSVLQIEKQHTCGVFEAGISLPNEMKNLADILRPNGGVFTNIGLAHQANFVNIEQKINEKAQLFNGCKWVLTKNDSRIIHALKNLPQPPEILVVGVDYPVTTQGSLLCITYEGSQEEYELNFTDTASLENAIYAIIAARKLGCTVAKIQEKMNLWQTVEMRMEYIQGPGSRVVVNDAYNSDPEALQLALEQLHTYRPETPKSLVITDFIQSDVDEQRLYKATGDQLKKYPFREIIAIGSACQRNASFFPENTTFYPNTDEALSKIDLHHWGNDTVLVKGARKFSLERLVYRLARQTHRTILDINFSAMERNLREIRSPLPQGVKLMAMVKAFSYGVGAVEMARFLAYQKVDYLAVAIIDEGIELRKAGISLPILVLNPDPNGFFLMSEYRLEPEIYSLSALHTWKKVVEQRGENVSPIHLKFDTGMHRLGFDIQDLEEVVSLVKGVPVASVMSHLGASEDAQHDSHTALQTSAFTQISNRLSQALGYPILRHILNTNGIIRHTHAAFDMVRLGIGIYGIGHHHLTPALEWKAHVMQVRQLSKGEKVGYGFSYSMPKDGEIAVISVGYADGLRRSLSNGKGSVYIRGNACPFVGKISMDMAMIDVTGIGCKEGESVEIIGPNQSIERLAADMDTIPYELLTGISPRVQRIYFRE